MKSCPVSRPVPAGNPLSRPEKSGHQRVWKLDTTSWDPILGVVNPYHKPTNATYLQNDPKLEIFHDFGTPAFGALC